MERIKTKFKNLKISSTIAIILMMTLSALFAIAPASGATLKTTQPYISVAPSTVGVGQMVSVNFYMAPTPVDQYNHDVKYLGFEVTLTKPDGTKEVIGPIDSDPIGSNWFNYVPDQVGTWSAVLHYPGSTLFDPSTSDPFTFVVQKDPVQIFMPGSELPQNYWSTPVSSQNREWYVLNGPWFGSGYNMSASNGNPYTQSPDSPHILWKTPIAFGGIGGGQQGYSWSLSQNIAAVSPGIIGGRLYYALADGLYCRDLRTGDLIWFKAGAGFTIIKMETPTIVHSETAQEGATGYTTTIWKLSGTSWEQYDAFSGRTLRTITGVPATGGGSFKFNYGMAYIPRQIGEFGQPGYTNELIAWNLSKVASSNVWSTGIEWNTTKIYGTQLPYDIAGGAGNLAGGMFMWSPDLPNGLFEGPGTRLLSLKLSDGSVVYNQTVDYRMSSSRSMGYGLYVTFNNIDRKNYAYDIRTGALVWTTEPQDTPWGVQFRGPTYLDGNIYMTSYQGDAWCYDAATGATKWHFTTPTTTETVYNYYPKYLGLIAGGGKFFVADSEHTATMPLTRGERLYAINTLNGKEAWDIAGAIAPAAIAEGILIGTNEYDNNMYAFGKGKTAVTISAPQTTVTQGTSVLIQGTVTDQSPAQKGTPAVSRESMSTWMEYLHMQNATLINNPPVPTGVPVKLTATDSSGKAVEIASVTSDGSGVFSTTWSPTSEGKYQIKASFDGTESYWASSSVTYLSVASAPTPAPTPTPTPKSNLATSNDVFMIGALSIVVILVAMAVIVMLLRRKQK
jgi:outer membrane protein assembly factor BamB